MREKEEKAIFSEEGDKDDGEEKRKALPLILVFFSPPSEQHFCFVRGKRKTGTRSSFRTPRSSFETIQRAGN